MLLVLPACGDLLDPAAAVVYGKKIPIEEVQRQLDVHVRSARYKQLAAQGDGGALQREFEQGRLSELIMRAVLTPAAAERGIEVTAEDVDARLDQVLETQFGGNRSEFEEAMKEDGLTEPQVRDILYDQILNDSLRTEITADVEPTEDDVREFYEENRREFEAVHAQHILVDERGLAQQLASRLQAAPENEVDDLFAQLAREHSRDGGSRKEGGDLGFALPGGYAQEFAAALAELDLREISDPVRTEFGWHVVRVLDTRIEPLERVRPIIESQIEGPVQDEAWTKFLRGLFEEAEVEVNPRYGVFDEDTLQVVDPDADDIPAGEAPAPSDEESPPSFPVPAPPG